MKKYSIYERIKYYPTIIEEKDEIEKNLTTVKVNKAKCEEKYSQLNEKYEADKKALSKAATDYATLFIEFQETSNSLNKLKEEYKKQSGQVGGLKKTNNTLLRENIEIKKENDLLNNKLSDLEEKLAKSCHNEVVAIKSMNEMKEECAKAKGIIDNLNKLVKSKMKSAPTAEEIINYDKKRPTKKF